MSLGKAGQRFPLMSPPVYVVFVITFKEVMLMCGTVGQAWGGVRSCYAKPPSTHLSTTLPGSDLCGELSATFQIHVSSPHGLGFV